jgi:hypothetical protein
VAANPGPGSGSVSPLKSATPTQLLPELPGSKLPLSANVASAAPVRIVIVSSPRCATARSESESPLNSSLAMPNGVLAGPDRLIGFWGPGVKAIPAAPVKIST